MNIVEEFGEFVFDFDDEFGFTSHSGNAGGSGSQGGAVVVVDVGWRGCSGGSGGHNSLTEQSPPTE